MVRPIGIKLIFHATHQQNRDIAFSGIMPRLEICFPKRNAGINFGGLNDLRARKYRAPYQFSAAKVGVIGAAANAVLSIHNAPIFLDRRFSKSQDNYVAANCCSEGNIVPDVFEARSYEQISEFESPRIEVIKRYWLYRNPWPLLSLHRKHLIAQSFKLPMRVNAGDGYRDNSDEGRKPKTIYLSFAPAMFKISLGMLLMAGAVKLLGYGFERRDYFLDVGLFGGGLIFITGGIIVFFTIFPAYAPYWF